MPNKLKPFLSLSSRSVRIFFVPFFLNTVCAPEKTKCVYVCGEYLCLYRFLLAVTPWHIYYVYKLNALFICNDLHFQQYAQSFVHLHACKERKSWCWIEKRTEILWINKRFFPLKNIVFFFSPIVRFSRTNINRIISVNSLFESIQIITETKQKTMQENRIYFENCIVISMIIIHIAFIQTKTKIECNFIMNQLKWIERDKLQKKKVFHLTLTWHTKYKEFLSQYWFASSVGSFKCILIAISKEIGMESRLQLKLWSSKFIRKHANCLLTQIIVYWLMEKLIMIEREKLLFH